MTKHVCVFSIVFLVLVGAGCEESFSPKAEFREQYVLQCFVKGDDHGEMTSVTAVLARTYDVDGFDPSVNTDDPAIAGAEVVLSIDQRDYPLKGTKRASRDTARYRLSQWVYTGSVPAPRPEMVVKVTATLPNGKTVTGQSAAPRARVMASNYDFGSGLTAHFSRQPEKPNWVLSWENYDDPDVHLFVPRLTIPYVILAGEVEQYGSVAVPLKYVSSQGGWIPVYPSMTTEPTCTFEFPALDSAMAQISAGAPQKGVFGTHYAVLEIIEYDAALTKYFSSINGSLDQYSIRTDESVYSNVGGGIGIVGTYVVHRVTLFFEERYVASFGYRYR
jgi:hypothetical protein